MRARLRSHLTYANVMATLAVFMVLGGSAYAAKKISGSNLKAESVSYVRIKDNTLTGGQINESSLGEVPEAQHAKTADTATTVLNQVNTPISVRQVVAFSANTTGINQSRTATANCANTEKAIAGGAAWVSANSTTVVHRNIISTSRPEPPTAGANNATGWVAAGRLNQPLATPARRLMAIAMCTPK